MQKNKTVQIKSAIVVALIAILACGCSVRSISDSGYKEPYGYGREPSAQGLYKGELSEFDVLGVNVETGASQEEIAKALDAKVRLTLPKGSSVMLIQSGAMIPDEAMVKALEKYYGVAVFSGVPEESGGKNYSTALRMAAARGGHEKMVVYWGLLETAKKGLGTKAVSWVPIVGGAIPDEDQEMRIRLKVAVVDVRSGQWDMFSPEPFGDSALSGRHNREAADQRQVGLLKAMAYEAAAEDLVKRYSK
ncbi:MAG: aminopeptidase [Deltaproteobacteria bacterium]|nr:aminopeptidase [Deltaproteobacteria bacterium]